MTPQEQVATNLNENVRRYAMFEDIIMVSLIILSLVGITIMNFSPKDGYLYWMAMILVFGIAAMVISFVQAKRGKHMIQEIWLEQSLLWVGVVAAMSGTLVLLKAGSLMENNTSLVMLLILSLACYIDGIRIGWRFSLVGNFLGLTAVAIAYLENFMWVLYVISAVTIGVTLYVEKRWIGR